MLKHDVKMKTSTVYPDNSMLVSKDIVTELGKMTEAKNVHIQPYYDTGENKLVFTVRNNTSSTLEELEMLRVQNIDSEKYKNGNHGTGKVSLNTADDMRVEQAFDPAKKAKLVIHNRDEDSQDPVWVSVYPLYDFIDRFSSATKKQVGNGEQVEERTVRNVDFADAVK